MHDFTFHVYRFSVLKVEHPSAALQDLLSRNGYRFIRNDYSTHNDQLWVDDSKEDLHALSSVPPASNIPHTMFFTYAHDILATKSPPQFYDNI